MRAITILFIFSFTSIFGQEKLRIDSLLSLYVEFEELNGCVLIAEGDKIIYENAYGNASFEWNIPNRPDTKFEIASASKPFTAVLILLLAQENKIMLTGKIETYLPELNKTPLKNITIEQLLLHTSGLTDTRFIPGFDDNEGMRPLSREALTDVFKDKALLFEPGTQWSYSNFGYNLLAIICERVTQQSYHDLIQNRIFVPCAMQNSSTTEKRTIHQQMAQAYEKKYGAIQRGHFHHSSSSVGASNIITTVEDYHKFFLQLIRGKILQQKYLKLFMSPQTKLSGEVTGFNLWFDKVPLPNNDTLNIIRSAGTMYGWNSVIYHIPETEKLLVMFFNVRNNRMFEIADNVINILYGIPFKKPLDNYAHIFYLNEKKKGLAYAIRQFRKLDEKYLATKRFRDFNRLAYYYLENNCVEHALAVFQLNVELFPDDAGVYDGLGEAFMYNGDIRKAIANYEKSLQLDPANSNAEQMLKKLRSRQ